MIKAVEKYYTVSETCLLLSLCDKTVIEKLKAGEFGQGVRDLAPPMAAGKKKQRHDYRIPASGLNDYLDRHPVFTEPGIAARTEGELRRKALLPEHKHD